MKPTNEHEEEIVRKVDRKARAIRDGVGALDNAIIKETWSSVGFEMSISDEQFLESYVSWRRRNPIDEE
jgi:hypothetical protein